MRKMLVLLASFFAACTLVVSTASAQGDVIAPSNVTPKLSIVGNFQSVIYWNASKDNVGVTEYDVYKQDLTISAGIDNGVYLVAQLPATSLSYFQDGGLNPGDKFAYTVVAVDAAGNSSQPRALKFSALNYSSATDKVVAGAVFSQADKPVSGAVVSTIVNGVTVSTKTNRNGAYKFTLPVGQYDFTASLNGQTSTFTEESVDDEMNVQQVYLS